MRVSRQNAKDGGTSHQGETILLKLSYFDSKDSAIERFQKTFAEQWDSQDVYRLHRVDKTTFIGLSYLF